MRFGRIAILYSVLLTGYVVALIAADRASGVFAHLPTALSELPVLILFATGSYILRFARWRWMLRLAGADTPLHSGLLAYLAGFALTATPGKVGELVRVRYFSRMGVPADLVVSAFVFERALDLLAVLMLASVAIPNTAMYAIAVLFVGVCISAVWLVFFNRQYLAALTSTKLIRGAPSLQRFLKFALDAAAGCAIWLTPRRLLFALLIGLCAWSLTALAFVYLLEVLNLEVAVRDGLAVYPLAMLAGAASMLPGGVGSTEAAVVLQLSLLGVTAGTALIAAVVVRLGTLWFSVILGLFATVILELSRR